MPSFLPLLKSLCFTLLFIACVLISPAVHAQQERVLQQVDLRLPGNQPLSAAPYLLPGLVARGIEAGKITPYRIDYETHSMAPLSLAQYRKSLEIISSGDLFGEEEDTLMLFPSALYLLALDVTKEKGALKKINYLHFSSMDHQAGFVKYHYSVSFSQLAAYLQEAKALWVKNNSALVWRNQVLHTYGLFPPDVLAQLPSSPTEEGLLLHFAENPKGKYEHLELYSRDQKLLKRIPYQDLLPAKDSSDIRWMDEALLAGLYQVGFADPRDGDEAEQKLSTTLPEAPAVASGRPAPAAFSIIQGEAVNTFRPENKKFKALEKDLIKFLNQAITQGRFGSLYSSPDLSEPMTAADWQERLSNLKEQAASTASSQAPDTSQLTTPITLYWKLSFNDKGEITARQPLALGFGANFRHTATGYLDFMGAISFEEAVKTLKEKSAARLLSDMRRRRYFAFWEYSSGISAGQAPANKRSRGK